MWRWRLELLLQSSQQSRYKCVLLLIWPVWCWNWTLTWSWWDYGRSRLVWPSGRRWLSAWVTEPTSLTCPWWHNRETVRLISWKENILISFLNMEPFNIDPDTVLNIKSSIVLINVSWDLQFSSFFVIIKLKTRKISHPVAYVKR